MKWNWGSKIVVAMAAFMIMIIIMVVYMFQQDISLVESDYYPRGQAHQEMIDKTMNTVPYASEIIAGHQNGTIVIRFPGFFRPQAVKGEVHFYHRITDTRDRFTELRLDENGVFSFPAEGLLGRYIIKIDWEQDGIGYYTEKSMTID